MSGLSLPLAWVTYLDPYVVPVLEAAMVAQDPEVCVTALDAVGINGTRQAANSLLAWLDHERARSLLKWAYHQEPTDEVKIHIIHSGRQFVIANRYNAFANGASERLCLRAPGGEKN